MDASGHEKIIIHPSRIPDWFYFISSYSVFYWEYNPHWLVHLPQNIFVFENYFS